MKTSADSEQVLCPSSKCEDGAQLLGIVKHDGHVDMMQHPLPVTKDAASAMQKKGNAEERFRFAGKCIKTGCSQWTGSRCGVIDNVLENILDKVNSALLPECAIRPQCRWFNQNGADACKVCPYVITDTRQLL